MLRCMRGMGADMLMEGDGSLLEGLGGGSRVAPA